MVYVMVKYQDPTTYALVDLSTDELEVVGRAISELESLYDRLGATEDDKAALRAVQAALDRRWDAE